MKLPRPRLTLRWMMITVAIVALGLGSWLMWRRSVDFAARAEFQRFLVTIFRDRTSVPPEAFPESREAVKMEQDRRLLHCHIGLASKYEHAARYPWLAVEPDPPSPE